MMPCWKSFGAGMMLFVKDAYNLLSRLCYSSLPSSASSSLRSFGYRLMLAQAHTHILSSCDSIQAISSGNR